MPKPTIRYSKEHKPPKIEPTIKIEDREINFDTPSISADWLSLGVILQVNGLAWEREMEMLWWGGW